MFTIEFIYLIILNISNSILEIAFINYNLIDNTDQK
jgi:hypothetical protein